MATLPNLYPGKVLDQYRTPEIQMKWEEYSNRPYNQHFQQYELKTITQQFKNNRAAGRDNIPYEILKLKSQAFIRIRLLLYNLSWGLGRFLNFARTAMIIYIFKGDDRKKFQPAGYQPISLFNTMSKELALLVAERLKTYTKLNPFSKV